MLILQDVSYIHPNRDLLFKGIDLNINKQDKIALIGNNGTGKSTLLKIMAGQLQASAGLLKKATEPYYVPQLFGQYNDHTVAEAMGIADKLKALNAILAGEVTEANLLSLDDDWVIEERCTEALAQWQLHGIDLQQKMGTLSGGQKTKVMLAGITLNDPQIVLLDEPSNHLDVEARAVLYDYIRTTSHTLVVVSHDRTLLNLLNTVHELSKRGVTVYGGNYEYYQAQKAIASEALNNDLKNKEKTLRKAKETERESIERQQKLDARGKKKQEKAGLPTISMNTLRNNAEKSTGRMKGVHAEKVDGLQQELNDLRKEVGDIDKMRMALSDANLHRGKVLITAKVLNVSYSAQMLWQEPLSFEIRSGERIAITGANGSGKTSLIKMMLGYLEPSQGSIDSVVARSIYIDQDYSLIDDGLTVYEQAQRYNNTALQEHEVKIRLDRFLFNKAHWDKPCSALSGGEKMRLMLCCLTIAEHAPDMIILDEPTNNLDMQNIEILTAAISNYKGTLLVISHDAWFLEQVGIERHIPL